MLQAESLYKAVYREIVSEIYAGKHRYGERLPSLEKICAQYDIGRNTARSVVQMLVENGYAKQLNHKQAVIAFRFDDPSCRRKYLSDLARRKDAIEDIFNVLALLMPEASVFALSRASEEEREKLSELCGGFLPGGKPATEQELFSGLFDVYCFAMSLAGQRLLLSLFESMFQFIQTPLLSTDHLAEVFSTVLPILRFFLKGFQRDITAQNYDSLKKRVFDLCISFRKRSSNYLKRICSGYSSKPVSDFFWTADRDSEYRYAYLLSDIFSRIIACWYRPGDPLPSYADLAEQYGVSEKTSRRAISLLNELGLAHTLNGRPTEVDFSHWDPAAFIQNGFIIKKLSLSMEAVELMSVLCQPVAVLAGKLIDKQRLADYESHLPTASYLQMDVLIDLCFASIPSPGLQSIYQQIKRLLSWGCLLLFMQLREPPGLLELIRRAIILLKEGKGESAGELFSQMYIRMLHCMKQTIMAVSPAFFGEATVLQIST